MQSMAEGLIILHLPNGYMPLWWIFQIYIEVSCISQTTLNLINSMVLLCFEMKFLCLFMIVFGYT